MFDGALATKGLLAFGELKPLVTDVFVKFQKVSRQLILGI